MTKRNINDSRMLARQQQYGNREQERAAIEAVDDFIFDKVRFVEKMTVDSAHRFMDESQAHLSEAEALTAELRELRRDLDYTDRITPHEAGKRYRTLLMRVEETQKKLDRVEQESTWLEVKAADPYSNYVSMTDKYNGILRPDLP